MATGDSAGGYFDALEGTHETPTAGYGLDSSDDYDDHEDNDQTPSADEAELARLAQGRNTGIGGFVDRIVNFGLFDVAEGEESGMERGEEEDKEERERRAVVDVRTPPTSLPLPLPPPPEASETGEKVGLWEDAAWLLSIAGRALT